MWSKADIDLTQIGEEVHLYINQLIYNQILSNLILGAKRPKKDTLKLQPKAKKVSLGLLFEEGGLTLASLSSCEVLLVLPRATPERPNHLNT